MATETTRPTADTQNLPPSPDIRQSLCHTLVAAGFLLVNLQNPFSKDTAEGTFHLIIMLALPIAVAYSWYTFYKRFEEWRKIPVSVRSRITRTPLSLKNRAVSHMLMALLASGLTALAYLGHLATPAAQQRGNILDTILVACDSVVGIVAIAIVASTIRDLIATIRSSVKT